MSLLNAVVGALANAQGNSKGGGAGDLLASVLGGGGASGGGGLGGLGGLGAMLGGGGGAPAAGGGAGGMGALAALLPVVIGMLSNNGGGAAAGGSQGGLGGLMEKFQQAGLGEQVNSWVSTGPNLPVSRAQLESALGADTIASIGRQTGLEPSQAGDSLAQLLPELVDRFTPNGQAPAGGLGSAEDLLGALLRR